MDPVVTQVTFDQVTIDDRIGLPPVAPMDMPTQVLERTAPVQAPLFQGLMLRLMPRHA